MLREQHCQEESSTCRDDLLSWVHFGDLHIRKEQDENYQDLLQLIDEVNAHFASRLNFAFLPGDNADDGSAEEYGLVRTALDGLNLPVQAIAGDHDRKEGTLDLFTRYLEPELYRAVDIGEFRLLFLNAMDGATRTQFAIGAQQMAWLEAQLRGATEPRLRPVIFNHLYPSEFSNQGGELAALIRQAGVELIEMGHTHYNELANNGHAVYAATRSTGQIQEGPPGFSITVIDGDVISWKFKERGQSPFVTITSPADRTLITKPQSANHVVRGVVSVKAVVWGDDSIEEVAFSIDGRPLGEMNDAGGCWTFPWESQEVADGTQRITVTARRNGVAVAHDEISGLVSQSGEYIPPARSKVDFENAIGAYPAKGIVGTQLGPNKNGTKGPWPSWRVR